MGFTDFLDPVLGWLTNLHPFIALLIVGFFISLSITLVYMAATDQKKMKSMKAQIKGFQEDMKKHKDNPEKMMAIQQESMNVNFKYMKESFKPTLITMLPIIIIFGWLSANMAYLPIAQGEEFSVTMVFDNTESESVTIELPEGVTSSDELTKEIKNNIVKWALIGDAGYYSLDYKIDGEYEVGHDLTIVEDKNIRDYSNPLLKKKDLKGDYEDTLKATMLEEIQISNERIRPMADIPVLKDIPWIGGFGWLGTYILFSLIFSIGIRKILKVS